MFYTVYMKQREMIDMPIVVKRSGREEPFDKAKLKKTVTAAGDEIRHPLNESDINVLTDSVIRSFGGREKITSKEVYEALIDRMRAQGFDDIAEAYIHFANNSWI